MELQHRVERQQQQLSPHQQVKEQPGSSSAAAPYNYQVSAEQAPLKASGEWAISAQQQPQQWPHATRFGSKKRLAPSPQPTNPALGEVEERGRVYKNYSIQESAEIA